MTLHTVSVGGARIAYVDTGAPAESSPTVLLVHGFPLTHAMWQAQIEGLATTCRVVAPDLRGYGESTLGDWPKEGESVSLLRYVDDLAAVIGEVRPAGPVVLVGFSMGGYVALVAQRRGDAWFDALVLMDTRSIADDDAARATRLKMAEKVGEWGAARVAELMRPKLFAAGTADAVVEATCQRIAAVDPATIAASQRAMAARHDSTPLLSSIDKPTLVLVGADDAISPPAEMRVIAEAIPDADYVEVAGAGHMAPVERPEAVTEALRRFLTERVS